MSATVVFGSLAAKASLGPMVMPSVALEDAVPASKTIKMLRLFVSTFLMNKNLTLSPVATAVGAVSSSTAV